MEFIKALKQEMARARRTMVDAKSLYETLRDTLQRYERAAQASADTGRSRAGAAAKSAGRGNGTLRTKAAQIRDILVDHRTSGLRVRDLISELQKRGIRMSNNAVFA